MKTEINKKQDYLLPFMGACIAFIIGYIHHYWVFPGYFHGDAAAMHVLAKSILDEGSLLPQDFSYGNQLVLFRSSSFIALAMAMGYQSYQAFVIGSALSIAFWGGLMSCFLNMYFTSHKKSLLFTALLLLPFGFWEMDYILGQQSHLSNVVFTLGVVVSFHRYLLDKQRAFLIAGSSCLFLMSIEAPMRGLLVFVPLFAAVALTANARALRTIGTWAFASCCIAYIVSKLLTRIRPIGVNYFNSLTFKPSEEILANFTRTSGETLASISSMNIIAGSKLSFWGLLVFGSALLLIITYFIFIFTGAAKAASSGTEKWVSLHQRDGKADAYNGSLLLVTATLGLIIGALAVAGLNPDSSRHYLWAVFLFKLLILLGIYHAATRVLTIKAAIFCTVAISLILSGWFANLVKNRWQINTFVTKQHPEGAIVEIGKLARETGIFNIYGEDFWRMMPLNTALPDVNGQTLVVEEGEIRILAWLTRPSWSCAKGDVLYYLRDGAVDKAIREKLEGGGGRQVRTGEGYSLWIGPAVWRSHLGTGCHVSALEVYGDAFLKLPSTVGVTENSSRNTNGKAGYLVFGPYAALEAGSYRLNVHGTAQAVGTAHVEVASNKGAVIHATIPLKMDQSDKLVQDAIVKLPTRISDLEIRIRVGEQDSIQLKAYSLQAMSSQ